MWYGAARRTIYMHFVYPPDWLGRGSVHPSHQGDRIMHPEGLTLVGLYFQFGEEDDRLTEMRAIWVYRTPEGVLINRSADDLAGERLSVISRHMTGAELRMLMDCIGTPVADPKIA